MIEAEGEVAQMNSEQGIAQNSAIRILQIDERREPLLVHLNQNKWSMDKDIFREAVSGGNTPAGWNIDRIYINKQERLLSTRPLKRL